jgi:hypothetical protein
MYRQEKQGKQIITYNSNVINIYHDLLCFIIYETNPPRFEIALV